MSKVVTIIFKASVGRTPHRFEGVTKHSLMERSDNFYEVHHFADKTWRITILKTDDIELIDEEDKSP